MKNLGTLGAIATTFLLLGNATTNPLLSHSAWRLIGFLVSLVVAFGCFFYLAKSYENSVLAFFGGGIAMLLCLTILGAVL